MLISRNWLQTFYDKELPAMEVLEDALTFHAFEIDGVEKKNGDDVLDVKITPNRGHDCLCHRGIAKELSAILQIPLKKDPLSVPATALFAKDTLHQGGSKKVTKAGSQVTVSLHIPLEKRFLHEHGVGGGLSINYVTDRTEYATLCKRYIAGYIKGVKVGPSPEWLKNRLEALGQRSINNVVDATNYVMFELGQPLHAFDAGKLAQKDGKYHIAVRPARDGEKLVALDEKEYQLDSSMLVIADAHANPPDGGAVIGIAGVKGGTPAGISEDTTDIILESANFDGVSVRKTAQKLKLRTDASARFEQVISPELAAYAMRAVADLIVEIAGGKIIECIDIYPEPQEKQTVSVTTTHVTQVLGSMFGEKEIIDAFDRLGFIYKQEGETFTVEVPFERLDLVIPEDLIEEVGRTVGYDHVPAKELPEFTKIPAVNKNFYWAEKIREYLTSQGFSEVYTSVFAEQGERIVLNKVDGVRPYMRTNITDGLAQALERNIRNKELLNIKQVRLFEIGSVWHDDKEEMVVHIAVEKVKKEKSQEEYQKELDAFIATIPESATQYDDLAISNTERYQAFSKFPYIVRDVAMWTPVGTNEQEVEELIKREAGELCVKVTLFDRFEKPASPEGGEGKVSLAYRLIFQSFERTLTDDDANAAMEKVYTALKARGFEIR